MAGRPYVAQHGRRRASCATGTDSSGAMLATTSALLDHPWADFERVAGRVQAPYLTRNATIGSEVQRPSGAFAVSACQRANPV